MICKSCGRSTSNEQANFCDYCGASYKEVIYVKNEDVQSKDTLNNEGSVIAEGVKPISFGNWMGTLLLPFIPIVGWIVNLVMMLVWAFGNDTSESKKNWARARLVVVIINIILVILVIALFMGSYMELINNGFDMEGYMNQMNQFY